MATSRATEYYFTCYLSQAASEQRLRNLSTTAVAAKVGSHPYQQQLTRPPNATSTLNDQHG